MANYRSNSTNRQSRGIEFEIFEHIGVISHNEKTSWSKEINLVSWNGGDTKLDIREWDPKHERMSKGITFTEEETDALLLHLNERFSDKSGDETATVQ